MRRARLYKDQQLAQPGIAEPLLARLKALFLQSQPCVVDKATRPGEAAHLSPLHTVGEKFELEGLQAFHGPMMRLVYEQ